MGLSLLKNKNILLCTFNAFVNEKYFNIDIF